MKVTFLREGKSVIVPEGETLLAAAILAGIRVDAPCGGNGTCGKCHAEANGREILLCQEKVTEDTEVLIPVSESARILTEGTDIVRETDGKNRYVLAFDIGTTTVVGYLLSGMTGEVLSSVSMLNPQISYGADVISRIQYVLDHDSSELTDCIREAITSLTGDACQKAGVRTEDVTAASIVGNTCMHHLFLGINPHSMTVPPYMPEVSEAIECSSQGMLPLGESAEIRILPNIAGFVGADTVACIEACGMDMSEENCLMIDIGTNGEMVLGNKKRRVACSTAAGPAFEGAKISQGMRGAEGAIDHVFLKDGMVSCHVIGKGKALGICGSGLLDLIACLRRMDFIDESGWMKEKSYPIPGTEVSLTQRDVREIQVAKAAIRAGIDLMTEYMGIEMEEIHTVYLAGAFGNYLNPASMCDIGMIPPELLTKIQPVGNAAGEGAKMCALSREAFERSGRIAKETEFLELATREDFQDVFIDELEFPEVSDEF